MYRRLALDSSIQKCTSGMFMYSMDGGKHGASTVLGTFHSG